MIVSPNRYPDPEFDIVIVGVPLPSTATSNVAPVPDPEDVVETAVYVPVVLLPSATPLLRNVPTGPEEDPPIPVSYTHLTLPTNREV